MAASGQEIQVFLRFLSQDAKIPLTIAIGKVKELQTANLMSTSAIAKCKPADLAGIFTEEKTAKQVIAAAKRVCKKRAAGEEDSVKHSSNAAPSIKKKARGDAIFSNDLERAAETNGDAQEGSLALPSSDLSEDKLIDVVVITNRAPLVLAFVVTLLKYTMPEQPLSSRLSLAQAYVSKTSRARAVNLGIEQGASADEEDYGQGQPLVQIMGKDIRVLRRWGYEWSVTDSNTEAAGSSTPRTVKQEDVNDTQDVKSAGQNITKLETESEHSHVTNASLANNDEINIGESTDTNAPVYTDPSPPLWALDLEAFKKSEQQQNAATTRTTNMPIHTPQSARAYLLKSFEPFEMPAKVSATAKRELRAAIVGHVLAALECLYDSWCKHLSPEELDRRTWSWYIQVRPDVQDGVAGWGGRNELHLSKILALRRGA